MKAVLLALLAACNRDQAPKTSAVTAPPVPVAAPVVDELHCEALPFEDSTPVPEASAAAWMTIDGRSQLVVTSDSGNRGFVGVVDPETGVTTHEERWPLGDAGDDIEGLAAKGGKLYGLSSSGWMRVWTRPDLAFALVDGPYPIGDGDLVCDERDSNCGRNYEGLCLANKPAAGSPCIGFALAKADGQLVCLVDGPGGKIAAKRDLVIAVGGKGAMADCAFDDTDRLWVGANIFDLNTVYRVDGWADPAKAKVVAIGAVGVGFSEVIAARGDILYRMSDTGGAPSSMAKFRCLPTGR